MSFLGFRFSEIVFVAGYRIPEWWFLQCAVCSLLWLPWFLLRIDIYGYVISIDINPYRFFLRVFCLFLFSFNYSVVRFVCVVFFLEVVLYGLLNFWNCKFRSFVKLELLSVSISSGILPLVCFYFLDMRILKRWVFYYRILRLILSSFSFWCLTLVSLYSSKSKLTVSLLTFTIFVTNRICFFFSSPLAEIDYHSIQPYCWGNGYERHFKLFDNSYTFDVFCLLIWNFSVFHNLSNFVFWILCCFGSCLYFLEFLFCLSGVGGKERDR